MAGSSIAAGITGKVDRANKHIGDADALIEIIVADLDAIASLADGDPQTGEIGDRLARNEVALRLVIGDAVHNLASALDHLAWQTVPKSQRDGSTGFPFFRDKPRNKDHICSLVEQKVGGARQEVRKAFRALEPHKEGKHHHLWVLHELDITDKHRLLITTRRQHVIEVTDAGGISDSVSYSVGDGGTEQEAAIQPADIQPNDNFEASFDIVFDEPGVAELEPVGPFLRTLVDATNDVICDFSKFL